MIKFYSKRTLKKNIGSARISFGSPTGSSRIGRIKVSPIATHFVPLQDLAFW